MFNKQRKQTMTTMYEINLNIWRILQHHFVIAPTPISWKYEKYTTFNEYYKFQ